MNKEIQNIGKEWLENLPNHWKIDRIKDVCEKITGGGTPKSSVSEYWDDGDIIWVTPTDFGKQKGVKYISKSLKNITPLGVQKSSATYLPKGTVIMSSRASIGEPKIAGEVVTTNQGFISYITNYKLHNNYLFYCIECQLGSYFLNIASGTTFMEISRRMASIEYIPLPPFQEQKSISEYLDKATKRIDRIIAIKQEQLLKMEENLKSKIIESLTKGLNPKIEFKDTGEKIIASIPKHWKVKRIKDVANIVGRIGFRGYKTTDLVQEGEGAITLSPSNIKGYSLVYKKNTFLSWAKYEESPEIKIFNGDIIFVKTGSSFGKVGLIKNLPEKATINPQLVVFKNLKINNRYLFYCLFSEIIQSQVNSSILGGTIPTLSQSKLGRCRLTVPPMNEQNEIVKYLNQFETKTFDAIANIKSQIKILQAYRKSLIHECVTGKKQISSAIKNEAYAKQ